MKVYAKRMADGSVDLYDDNGDVLVQFHTAAEELLNHRNNEELAESIRDCGWNVEWLRGGE